MTETFVYKLLTEADYAIAVKKGATDTALDVADGYVHLSSRAQTEQTARLHYRGKGSVHLLRFPIADLPELKWEESRGGQLFPHLYGALEIAAADEHWELPEGSDGAPLMPETY